MHKALIRHDFHYNQSYCCCDSSTTVVLHHGTCVTIAILRDGNAIQGVMTSEAKLKSGASRDASSWTLDRLRQSVSGPQSPFLIIRAPIL